MLQRFFSSVFLYLAGQRRLYDGQNELTFLLRPVRLGVLIRFLAFELSFKLFLECSWLKLHMASNEQTLNIKVRQYWQLLSFEMTRFYLCWFSSGLQHGVFIHSVSLYWLSSFPSSSVPSLCPFPSRRFPFFFYWVSFYFLINVFRYLFPTSPRFFVLILWVLC